MVSCRSRSGRTLWGSLPWLDRWFDSVETIRLRAWGSRTMFRWLEGSVSIDARWFRSAGTGFPPCRDHGSAGGAKSRLVHCGKRASYSQVASSSVQAWRSGWRRMTSSYWKCTTRNVKHSPWCWFSPWAHGGSISKGRRRGFGPSFMRGSCGMNWRP